MRIYKIHQVLHCFMAMAASQGAIDEIILTIDNDQIIHFENLLIWVFYLFYHTWGDGEKNLF